MSGTTLYDVTGFQRDCLVVIVGYDSLPGLAIKDELDDYYASGSNHGRLYPTLDTLVDEVLVGKGQIDDRTHASSLTDEGHELIDDRYEWEHQYVDISSMVDDEFRVSEYVRVREVEDELVLEAREESGRGKRFETAGVVSVSPNEAERVAKWVLALRRPRNCHPLFYHSS